MARRSTPAKPKAAPTPLLEWLVAAAGLAFVLTALGLIVFAELAGDGSAPAVRVRAEAIDPVPGGGWLVRFEAVNPGRAAAAEVEITGALRAGGQEIESRSVVLDYVPGGGRRGGGLLFRNDPRAADLELVAEGYREP